MGKYIAWLGFLPVLIAVSESFRFMGCYKENSIEARLMHEEKKNFPGSLTPAVCVEYCKSKGFSYAGLQVSVECFCSKNRPSYMKLADEHSDCSSKCDGDKSQTCGGPWRLSVYDIDDKGINHVQGSYEGCFADDGESRRALRGKTFSGNMITPEYCVGYCLNHGYKYAGVQYSDQCFCGDAIEGEPTSGCTMRCAGDGRFTCGSSWKSDIYRTSVFDEYTPQFVGCFIDSSTRLLSGIRLVFRETNSPRRCLSICSLLGFKFAGLEVGVECFCGNKHPDPQKETNENQCLTLCSNGKDSSCGGAWRLAVYTAQNSCFEKV